jgi:hypothetical protein
MLPKPKTVVGDRRVAGDAFRCPRLRHGHACVLRRRNGYKQDEIVLRQLHALKEHQGPREKALGLSDVKKMFAEMKGVVG